ncbi:TRAP transporter substrate-binding protein [Acuticoccus sp. M5D2P5]|uniref:TRAP transporter substrate-binding protein n=1 Tax=Acuticoccus kalidii TaxID=2910977 RepID=UPI001F193F98|nr:TRAP transporter substrate-binding protein [Acuticoccus kalidii]MCF3933431.1 TRAP transporter substrate-binding protein [Acuticoccus kalidii]
MRVSLPVVAALGAMLPAVVAAPALAQDIRLQAATIAPPDNLWSKVGDRYAERVAERTNGEVEIDMSYSGSLGNAGETIEALQFGTVDIVIQEVGQLDSYDPLAGLGVYPYLVRDIDHFRQLFADGGVGEEFYDAIEERSGFKLIGAGYRGPREMASRREIKTPDDLAGLKMRVPNQQTYRATWDMLGASPTPMPSLEVYTAMQQGIIDAAENPLEAHLRSKYHEAVSYVIMTDHVNPYYTFIFDSANFRALPEDVQEILIEEGKAAMEWGTEQILAALPGYEETLKENGVTIVEPDRDAFRAKLEPLKDEYPADMQEWIERFQAVGQ